MFDNGGPMFPINREQEENGAKWIEYSDGASLWDMYAAMDLPVSEDGDWLGWFDGKTIVEAFGKLLPDSTGLDKMKWLAMVEAKIRALRADAMIAEREKRRANLAST